jgi:NAD-dependent SIR2 family protein deacetylase
VRSVLVVSTRDREGATHARNHALAAFETQLPRGTKFQIVTQNVDDLHQRAGSRNVCELHGSLMRWRCEVCRTELEPPDGDAPVHCGERMRPAVVLFGEMIPVDAERTVKQALRDCDLFVAIGTSGTVEPASSFVRWAELNGARRMLLNLEIFDGARARCSPSVTPALPTSWCRAGSATRAHARCDHASAVARYSSSTGIS